MLRPRDRFYLKLIPNNFKSISHLITSPFSRRSCPAFSSTRTGNHFVPILSLFKKVSSEIRLLDGNFGEFKDHLCSKTDTFQKTKYFKSVKEISMQKIEHAQMRKLKPILYRIPVETGIKMGLFANDRIQDSFTYHFETETFLCLNYQRKFKYWVKHHIRRPKITGGKPLVQQQLDQSVIPKIPICNWFKTSPEGCPIISNLCSNKMEITPRRGQCPLDLMVRLIYSSWIKLGVSSISSSPCCQVKYGTPNQQARERDPGFWLDYEYNHRIKS